MNSRTFGLGLLLLFTLAVCPGRSGIAAEPAAEPDSIAAVTAQVDALIERGWAEAALTPVAAADDATFLRRVTLDLTGLLPTVGELRKFLADTDPGKRTRVVTDLLQRPRHASHLASLWRDVLLPRNSVEPASTAFEGWLQTRFLRNTPYDALVREIVTARGTLGQSEPAIFYAALNTKPEELAASASRAFLGLQVRCAQCHDHPFTEWKQEDFWGFAAFFARVQGPGSPGESARVDDRPDGEVRHPKTLKVVAPQFLDGTRYAETTAEPRRAVLARWLTSPENPFFARATVNRLWWILFGRGIVQPVDDLGDHNPATHPEVLDLLAADLIAHNYDLRRTIQIIAGTRAYQLESIAPADDKSPETTYTAMPVRSLSSRQIYDALMQASGRREALDAQVPAMQAERQAFVAQFDAPTRQPTEYQGGIPQALTLLNGALVAQLTNPATGDLIAALADSPFLSDEQRIETLFLATLSRLPNAGDRERTLVLIRSRQTPEEQAQALGDILWALLNSSEFVLNR